MIVFYKLQEDKNMTEKEWNDVVKQVGSMKDVQQGVGTLIDVFSDMSIGLAKELPGCDSKEMLLNFYKQAKSHRQELMDAVAANLSPIKAQRKKRSTSWK